MRRAAPSASVPTTRPSVAICLSAYNEERVIAQKIETLIAMAARYGNATIHVYADAPADGTVAILKNYADRIDLVIGEARRGKTFGMNTLVARSSSELILFTDANVVSDTDALEKLVAPFADASIGCASAKLIYSNSDESVASKTGASYWAIEESIKAIETRTVGLIGVDGAMFMLRRSLHEPPASNLIDDLTLSLGVLVRGARLVTVADVLVYERSAVKNMEEYARKKRIACQAMNVHRIMWPRLKAMPFPKLYAYVSHRLLKWLTPFLLLGFGFALLILGARHLDPITMIGLIVSGIIIVAAGIALRIKPFKMIASAAISLAGVGMGILEALFSRQDYVVWDPALSVRSDQGEG